MIIVADVPVVDFLEGVTIRLISTAYITEPALAPLVKDVHDLAVLEAIEGMTSARRGSIVSVPAGVSPNELLNETYGYGWTYINAAFCYTRPTGNRFNGPERGAWHAAHGENAARTAQAEVAWHLTRELANVGVYDNLTSYRELLAGIATRFHDLTGFANEDVLSVDTDVAYPAGQILARGVLQSGGMGVLYPSVRCSDGRCLAAFRPHVVQNVRQGQTWIFEWRGESDPTVTAQPLAN